MRSKLSLWLALGGLGLVGACALSPSAGKIPADWEQTSYVERGEYLVNYLGHCVGCHTPLGKDGRSDMSLFLSGVPAKFAGAKAGPPQVAGFPGPRGARVYAKNLTPDAETGLGRWTEEQFVERFTSVADADEAALALNGRKNTEMPWRDFGGMKTDDLRAMFAYLQTIPPVRHAVPR